MRGGWFRESYRHKLAAHGIQTSRYFVKKGASSPPPEPPRPEQKVEAPEPEQEAKKLGLFPSYGRTPKTVLETVRRQKELEPELEEVKRVYGTTVGKAAYAAQMGSPTAALELLESGKLSSQNATYLKTSLMQYAVSRVQSDLPVPDAVKSQLDTSQLENLKKTAESRKPETAEGKVVRELEQKAVVSALETPGIVAGAAGGALAAGLREEGKMISDTYNAKLKPFPGSPGGSLDFPGITEVGPEAGGLPFFTDNFFLKGGVENSTSQKLVGPASDLKTKWDSGLGGASGKTYAEKVQERIDTLFFGKGQLAEVDEETPYRKGSSAFEKGDREALIDAIVDLKSQEGTLRDRWALVSAAHNQLVSVQNNESLYGDNTGNIALSSFLGNGASRMADQTKKLNAVKAEIKKANDRVFNRRRLLEYRMQRLDASVPPEVGAPEKVDVLKPRSNAVASIPAFMQRAEMLATDVDNPVLRRDS